MLSNGVSAPLDRSPECDSARATVLQWNVRVRLAAGGFGVLERLIPSVNRNLVCRKKPTEWKISVDIADVLDERTGDRFVRRQRRELLNKGSELVVLRDAAMQGKTSFQRELHSMIEAEENCDPDAVI